MNTNEAHIIAYSIALVSEFARHYQMTDKQSFAYLKRFGAISLIFKHYNTAHTLSFEDNIEMISKFCNRAGGELNYETISRN